MCSVQNFKYSQTKSIWIKLLKKWFRVVKAIFKSMSKMIPGFTLGETLKHEILILREFLLIIIKPMNNLFFPNSFGDYFAVETEI